MFAISNIEHFKNCKDQRWDWSRILEGPSWVKIVLNDELFDIFASLVYQIHRQKIYLNYIDFFQLPLRGFALKCLLVCWQRQCNSFINRIVPIWNRQLIKTKEAASISLLKAELGSIWLTVFLILIQIIEFAINYSFLHLYLVLTLNWFSAVRFYLVVLNFNCWRYILLCL